MLTPKLNFGPVADAFARVINVAAYQGKWIIAKDYACIINYEHDLSSPASMVDADTKSPRKFWWSIFAWEIRPFGARRTCLPADFLKLSQDNFRIKRQFHLNIPWHVHLSHIKVKNWTILEVTMKRAMLTAEVPVIFETAERIFETEERMCSRNVL